MPSKTHTSDEIFKRAKEFAEETNPVYIAERLEKILVVAEAKVFSSNAVLSVSVLPTEERWSEIQKLLIYEKQNAETFVDGNGSLKTNALIEWMKTKVGVGKTDR